MKLAVLISDKGTGTNLQAIIDAIHSKNLNSQISAVVSDTEKSEGLKRAKKNKLPIYICAKKEDLLKLLKKISPDYVVLAGWKQFILDGVIDAFPERILNLHPGLIPDKVSGFVKNPDGTAALWNKGMLANKAIDNFLKNKKTYAGSSVHFLTHEFDFGQVLERGFVKTKKNDSIESLYARLKSKEHEIYVSALKKLEDTNSGKTVLITDGGGRGAVLAEKYSQSPHVKKVLVTPGNDLMEENQKVQTFPDVKTTDTEKIIALCKKYNVDLVDVAQDNAVAVGTANALQKQNIKVFGPTKEAGQIEWDKAWSRNFMDKFKIPSPKYQISTSTKQGIDFIKKQKEDKYFIKASGLAAGKGALFAKDKKEAQEKIKEMESFGEAGKTYLIEQCIEGEEFSSFALVDGNNFILLGEAQDHKRVDDGDLGPNTGGMGSSSPPMVITAKIKKQINEIFKKTAQGLVKLKRPYRGILYLGGIVDQEGKVCIIEFNARWGDPEAQVLVPSIKNDFYQIATETIAGNIKNIKIQKDNLYRVAVAAASKGYPDDYKKVNGLPISGMDKLLKSKIKLYGAGVKKQGKKYTAAGGRLFYVVGEGKDVAQARRIAYNALSLTYIQGNNLHYRKDIGYRDINRSKAL